MFEISGTKVLITGGASGLGAAYAEGFLKEADKLGEATVKRLNQLYPGSATFIKCDVSKEEDISRAFNEVVSEFGYIDQGLISFTMKGVKHMRKDDPSLNAGRGGTIINISSVAAILKSPFTPIYSGCKAAVMHFSQTLAMESFYENTGIRILTNCLGATDTALLHNLEKRSYDPKIGENVNKKIEELRIIYQK
ncbi:unnamed protein product [Diatraea saccharalis]|uniref:Uncharacterized protein n=1 Tax=Diatraea saccharalis TaxID=40085 RepID=A0A9N9R5F9_9NEOP|nr:unnamed protein product [Diatraea saccharalis]